ncbi:MAG: hypothetical protein AAFU71_18730 [Cyanobacteria bacterium J06632_22]
MITTPVNPGTRHLRSRSDAPHRRTQKRTCPAPMPTVLHAIEVSPWLFEGESNHPSEEAIELLADHLWERKHATGRHLVVYGLPDYFKQSGRGSEALGPFLDCWAIEAFKRHAQDHAMQARFAKANRPLGGLNGSLDYVKSFIPGGRRFSELYDLRRGLRYQGMLFQRDLSAACTRLGVDKATYLANTAPIVDVTMDSIKLPHTDAGTTISILHIDQNHVDGGRSRLTDLRGLLAHVRQTEAVDELTILDLLAPLRKQGTLHGYEYSTDVVLGLRPEYHPLAEALFTLTIPDPAQAITFFVNDLFDSVTGRLSGILHGAETPRPQPSTKIARRTVMNRAVLAQLIE